MSTLKTPPSYTVLSGPVMMPVKCVEFASSASILTPLEVSLRNSYIKLGHRERVLSAYVPLMRKVSCGIEYEASGIP